MAHLWFICGPLMANSWAFCCNVRPICGQERAFWCNESPICGQNWVRPSFGHNVAHIGRDWVQALVSARLRARSAATMALDAGSCPGCRFCCLASPGSLLSSLCPLRAAWLRAASLCCDVLAGTCCTQVSSVLSSSLRRQRRCASQRARPSQARRTDAVHPQRQPSGRCAQRSHATTSMGQQHGTQCEPGAQRRAKPGARIQSTAAAGSPGTEVTQRRVRNHLRNVSRDHIT